MKIFINYQLCNAFKSALKRDKIDAMDFMVSGGMGSVKACLFVEAFSQDLEDSWQAQKAFCLTRKSTLKCYDTGMLYGFRWYEVL